MGLPVAPHPQLHPSTLHPNIPDNTPPQTCQDHRRVQRRLHHRYRLLGNFGSPVRPFPFGDGPAKILLEACIHVNKQNLEWRQCSLEGVKGGEEGKRKAGGGVLGYYGMTGS